ncbi:MAG: transcriptional regulator [Cyclobacteriaceae bacterium]
MDTLKYKVISSRKQYDDYCKMLEGLIFMDNKGSNVKDEISLLTVLIEKYDSENISFDSNDPIVILKFLMKEQQLKPKELADILMVSKGLVSDILNYKKGLSKPVIRKLSEHFKVAQEIFLQAYNLKKHDQAKIKVLTEA